MLRVLYALIFLSLLVLINSFKILAPYEDPHADQYDSQQKQNTNSRGDIYMPNYIPIDYSNRYIPPYVQHS
ncbi:hypothetical protein K1T71_012388 [Dendrolimus kikuchii]|uniref:Uncharacterized protein n=1 Tax=Dendrolimus kikuchii TaxID=765133 RepID=A0ACC1CLE3_9NEOP|nr:hypothetical protein K1T71_012388 [Dendrolimus kikuchii]